MRTGFALFFGRSLVDLQGEGLQHHAIIFQGTMEADEAARDILLHQRRVTGIRIAPPPAATGL
jgi:hypothetical protein